MLVTEEGAGSTCESPKSAHTENRGKRMPAVVDDLKKQKDDLKAKRDLLFARYMKNPGDIGLALKIKVMDDQMAELTERRELKKRPKP
jgi:hypothetical protein